MFEMLGTLVPKKKNWRLEFVDLVAKITGDQAQRPTHRFPAGEHFSEMRGDQHGDARTAASCVAISELPN